MQMTPVFEHIKPSINKRPLPEIHYPERDGNPVGETDFHIAVIFYLRQALRFVFRQATDVYVAANMLFYYEEGNNTVYKVPDVFVVKGVPKHDRRTYKLWEEGAAPSVVFEITSRSTRWEDTGDKKGLYAELGIREYFLFDPLNEYLKPRFQGFKLEHGGYQPMRLAKDGTLISRELNLILKPDGHLLRLIDLQSGKTVPTLDEAMDVVEEAVEKANEAREQANEAMKRIQTEAQRANAAESELAQARAEIEKLKRQAGSI